MVFLKNQIPLPSPNPIGDDYAYNQMYKKDNKNIDRNIVKHTTYIDKIIKDKLFSVNYINKKN